MARRPNRWMMTEKSGKKSESHILAIETAKDRSEPHKPPALRGAKVKTACGKLIANQVAGLAYGRPDCAPCKTYG